MSHKKKHPGPGPIPPANQSKAGPRHADDAPEEQPSSDGAPFEDQDPKRRQGDFTGKGEHPFVQPGGRNDADR